MGFNASLPTTTSKQQSTSSSSRNQGIGLLQEKRKALRIGLLTSIPTIHAKNGKSILEKFGSLAAGLLGSAEELACIEGMGKKKVEVLSEILLQKLV